MNLIELLKEDRELLVKKIEAIDNYLGLFNEDNMRKGIRIK